MSVTIQPSTRKDKRLMAKFPDGTTTHFGAKGGSTFVDHGDKKKKRAWEARHSKAGENWRDLTSAGGLAKGILWNRASIAASVADLNKSQDKWRFSTKNG